MGTLINCGLIILGGIIGLLFKKAVSDRMEHAIEKAMGVAVVMVGLCGALSVMLRIEDGRLKSSGELMLVVSLGIGTFFGEVLKLDQRLERSCKKIERKFNASNFSEGFISASLIYCIGAMAIMGSIQDGLMGDSSILITKGIIDGITSVVLAAALGYGVLFSAVPVLIYQGLMTLLAGTLETVLVGQLLDNICMVGYVLVLCIGINFLSPKEHELKTVNMLPAILVPVVYAVILHFI